MILHTYGLFSNTSNEKKHISSIRKKLEVSNICEVCVQKDILKPLLKYSPFYAERYSKPTFKIFSVCKSTNFFLSIFQKRPKSVIC